MQLKQGGKEQVVESGSGEGFVTPSPPTGTIIHLQRVQPNSLRWLLLGAKDRHTLAISFPGDSHWLLLCHSLLSLGTGPVISNICGYSSPFCKMEHLHSVECFNISGLSTTLHTSERYVITLILHCLSNHPGRKEGVLDVVYAPLFSPQITDLKKFQFPRKSHAGEREI